MRPKILYPLFGPLTSIKGIGPKRKKDLMIHFGTVQKIKIASMDELRKIKTIPLKKLEEIYKFFNGL